MITVVVADDEAPAREALAVILGAEEDLEVVATAADGEEVVALASALRPAVVVMDLRMPGTDGLVATRRLARLGPGAPAVLVLTAFGDQLSAEAAMRAGAAGFCTKADPPQVVVSAIRTVAAGGCVVSPRLLGSILARIWPSGPASPDCSRRELEILAALACGETVPTIAARLYISPHTVRGHLEHLRAKLGAPTQAALVARAAELGLLRRSPDRSA